MYSLKNKEKWLWSVRLWCFVMLKTSKSIYKSTFKFYNNQKNIKAQKYVPNGSCEESFRGKLYEVASKECIQLFVCIKVCKSKHLRNFKASQLVYGDMLTTYSNYFLQSTLNEVQNFKITIKFKIDFV